MTDEELRQKYRFLKVVAQEGGRTFHALDGGGRVVMVHYLAEARDPAGLLEQIGRLGTVDRRRILDRYDVAGAPVIVTEFIQGFKTFAAWVGARVPGPPAGDHRTPGESTNLFGPGTATAALGPTAQPLEKPRQSPPTEPAAAQDAATQLLVPPQMPQGDLARGTQPLRAAGPRPTTPVPPPAPSVPSGMTQFFGATEAAPPAPKAAAPAPPPRAPNATPATPAGGMTQLFGAKEDEVAESAPKAVSPQRPPAQPSTPPAPGNLTQMFGKEEGSPPPPPPPTAPSRPQQSAPSVPPAGGSKPSVHWREAPPAAAKGPPVVHLKLDRPNVPPAAGGAPARAGQSPPVPPPSPKPAGEFTRLFGAGETGNPAPPPPPVTGPRVQAPSVPVAPTPPTAPLHPPAAPSAPKAPGEFTQLFQPKASPPPLGPTPSDRDYRSALSAPAGGATPAFGPPTAPPPAAKQPGEFTQLMSGGMLPPSPPAAPTPSVSARAAPPSAPTARPAGPGEFTRIISSPPPSAPQVPAAVPRPAPVAAPRVAVPPPPEDAESSGPRSRLVLLLALGLLGLTAVALILFVVLRAKS